MTKKDKATDESKIRRVRFPGCLTICVGRENRHHFPVNFSLQVRSKMQMRWPQASQKFLRRFTTFSQILATLPFSSERRGHESLESDQRCSRPYSCASVDCDFRP